MLHPAKIRGSLDYAAMPLCRNDECVLEAVQSCRRTFIRVSRVATATMNAVKTMERMIPGNPQAK